MKTFVLTTLLCVSLTSFAQQETKILTLDECITFALENNIALKRAKNGELVADANKFQSLMNFLPSINASVGYDYYFGTFFDTNAERQITETTNSSRPDLSANMILFNGFSNQYSLKQRAQEQSSSKAAVEGAELGVKANILAAYLNAILSKENMKISQERVELLESQLEREEKRVTVGVGSLDAVYNFRSQLSNEKLNLTNFQNTISTNLLTLVQAMQLDPRNNYDVAPLEIDENDLLVELDPFNQTLSESYSYSPSLKGSEAARAAAKYSMKSTVSDRYPTLSVFGQIGSRYSSNGAINPTKPARDPDTGEGGFNYEPNATYFDQLGYNQFEYIGFSLDVPIFNRFLTNRNIQVAKIGVLNADLDYKQAENTVTNAIQQAYLDVINAQSTYSTAIENQDAQNSTFEFIKKRFETGNTDFYSYLESLNNKNRAEAQLVNAKYIIVLRKKILNLYRGL